MGFFIRIYRTLFGRTPVHIEGAFDLEQTIDRIWVVLSPGFFSQHLQHTLNGHLDGHRLELMYGWHPQYASAKTGITANNGQQSSIMPSPSFIGDFEIIDDHVCLRGYLEASMVVSVTAAVLIGFMLGFIPLIVPVILLYGQVFPVVVMMLYGITVPVILLMILIKIKMDRGRKMIEMLQWLMTERLE